MDGVKHISELQFKLNNLKERGEVSENDFDLINKWLGNIAVEIKIRGGKRNEE